MPFDIAANAPKAPVVTADAPWGVTNPADTGATKQITMPDGSKVTVPVTQPVGVSAATQDFYQFGAGQIDPATGLPYARGAYAAQAAQDAINRANVQHTRAAPQVDYTKAQGDFFNARAAQFQGAQSLGQGTQILGQANAIGTQQQGLANQLQAAALGQGPSVAELAMQRAAAEQGQHSLAMAAGGTGPGANAALINATNQNAVAQGQLEQNLGIQRAQEIAQARGQLGDVLGTMRGQTGAAAGQYGELASQYGQLGGLGAQLGQIEGQQGLANAQLQSQQNTLNQQGEQYYYGQGADWQKQQAALNAQYAANWNNFFTGQSSVSNAAQIAQQQHEDALLGAGVSTAGAVLGTLSTIPTGGATAPVAGGAIAKAASDWGKVAGSDIRAKTQIAPAGSAISDAYRGVASANDQARQIRSADVAYPSPFSPLSGSSYYYREPSAPGREPGQQFGPMAQELERTPAGRSAVRVMPDGTKGIDTGRLALLNASETGQLRREIDALKAESPALQKAAALKRRNDQKEAEIAGLESSTLSGLQAPVAYPQLASAIPTARYTGY